MKTPILRLLELMVMGNTFVIESEEYIYTPIQPILIKETENCYSILSRIKFELFGEYPLSHDNEKYFMDYIELTFNFKEYYMKMAYNGYSIFE